jgi:hypothetical protein
MPLMEELPEPGSGGYEQVIFDIQLCLTQNSQAVAQLGDDRSFLAGELPALVQYGAEPGEDENPLRALVVAIGAAGVGINIGYRLTLVRPDSEGSDKDALYATIREDLFHTNPKHRNVLDYDAEEADDWRSRLGAARFSVEASWFHISKHDESPIIQAANWGDMDMQERLQESRHRIKNWRELRQALQRYVRTGESPIDYDY